MKLVIRGEVYVKDVWGEISAAQGVTGKMLPRFVGPYEVIEVVLAPRERYPKKNMGSP